MMQKLHNRLSATKRDERGSGEIVAFLFAFPFIWFILMSLIDVSIWFSVRGQVQQFTNTAARLTAYYGGDATNIPTNSGRNAVAPSKAAEKLLYSNGKCTQTGGCPSGYVPDVTCWIGDSANDNGDRIASKAGQRVTCETRYKFSQVVQGDIFGFVGITTKEFKVRGYQFTETGFGG